MNLARSTAITSGDDASICPTADGQNCGEASWGSGWIVFNDLDSDGSVDDGEMIRVVTFDNPQNASGFDNLIVFQSNGTTSLGTDAVITSCAQNNKYSDLCLDVTVSAFGMIKAGSHADQSVAAGGEVAVN